MWIPSDISVDRENSACRKTFQNSVLDSFSETSRPGIQTPGVLFCMLFLPCTRLFPARTKLRATNSQRKARTKQERIKVHVCVWMSEKKERKRTGEWEFWISVMTYQRVRDRRASRIVNRKYSSYPSVRCFLYSYGYANMQLHFSYRIASSHLHHFLYQQQRTAYTTTKTYYAEYDKSRRWPREYDRCVPSFSSTASFPFILQYSCSVLLWLNGEQEKLFSKFTTRCRHNIWL